MQRLWKLLQELITLQEHGHLPTAMKSYTLCTCKRCETKGTQFETESSLRSQQQRKVERSRPYLSSLPEEKSNQAESPLVGFVWRNSAVRHVKLNIMMSIWDKTSVTEYFQRHCKFKLLSFVFLCYFFSFTKGLQQQNNNNILFHTLYITCYDIQRALATLDF